MQTVPTPTSPALAARPDGVLAALGRYVRFVADVGGVSALVPLAVVAVTGLFEGVSLLLLVPLLQLVGVDVGGGVAGGVADLIARGFRAVHLEPSLLLVLAVFVAVFAAQALLVMTQSLVNLRLEQRLTGTLRREVASALLHADWVFLSRQRASELAHVLTSQVDRVGTITYQLLGFASASAYLLVGTVVAARLAPLLTAAVCAGGLLVAARMGRRVERSRVLGEHYAAESTRTYALFHEALGSLRATKALGAEARTIDRLTHANERMLALWRESVATYVHSKLRLDLVSVVTLAVVVYAAVRLFAVSPGTLLVLLLIFARLVPRVSALQASAQLLVHALPAHAVVDGLLAACRAQAEPGIEGGERLRVQSGIELAAVTVSYDPARPLALDSVSLRVPAGRLTAIVGPSGAGKTTIADVLLGLVRPTAGAVRVDDVPLTPERARRWRGSVAYVSQDTVLFHDSIRANLLWAQPQAAEPEMWEALALAGASSFVAALPAGLDTVIGDRGVLVSGGERQRIAIARALLRRPDVLILDEPTSALDAEHEQRILDTLAELRGRVTMVLITHRLGAVRQADIVYVVDGGRIVESGEWSLLMAAPAGRLRQLAAIQGVSA